MYNWNPYFVYLHFFNVPNFDVVYNLPFQISSKLACYYTWTVVMIKGCSGIKALWIWDLLVRNHDHNKNHYKVLFLKLYKIHVLFIGDFAFNDYTTFII